jgi:hypothetical protein
MIGIKRADTAEFIQESLIDLLGLPVTRTAMDNSVTDEPDGLHLRTLCQGFFQGGNTSVVVRQVKTAFLSLVACQVHDAELASFHPNALELARQSARRYFASLK